VCRVETDRLVLFRKIMAVCCGNCRKHISAQFVAICCLMSSCWANNLLLVLGFIHISETVLCCAALFVSVVGVVVIVSVNVTVIVT
jgi:hypothetical protein